MSTNTVKEGDFNALNLDSHSIEMLADAYQAVTKANRWGYLKRSDVPAKGKGFMFSDAEELREIDLEMKYGGHSGSSYAWTMRSMEMIAKQGWNIYAKEIGVKPAPKPFSLENFVNSLETNTMARALIPDLDEQLEGMRRYDKAVKDAQKDPSSWNKSAGFPYPCPCRRAQGKEGWCGVAGFGVPACEH